MSALWQRSREVCVATAFLSVRMLNIMMGHIRNVQAGITVRFLTGTMNQFNEPRVLTKLIEHFGFENVRVFQPQGEDGPQVANFHVKSYLFLTNDEGSTLLLGSSNFTAAALLGAGHEAGHGNTEWNLLVRSGSPENDTVITEISARFEHYWSSASVELTGSVLEEYCDRWEAQRRHMAEMASVKDVPLDIEPPRPHPVQRQALERLAAFRIMELRRAAIIGATGIGKTMIAAFDARSSGAHRVLFVAHRYVILQQALENYRSLFGSEWDYHILGGGTGTHPLALFSDADVLNDRPCVVFAMIQTLSKPYVYKSIPPTHFDYVVVDEFHHASAKSYAHILQHFAPPFLLGLTATPERLDGRDVLEVCDYNVALEVRLFDAIDQACIAPFLYFAIYDERDYEEVRWTGIGYDEHELERFLSNDTRATLIANSICDHVPAFGKVKAVAFCVNVGHARFMAQALSLHGYETGVILGDTPEPERQAILQSLSDENDSLQIVCAVDVLSEGIDVPALTHILLLRPTQSFTVFLQQLGRGLRRHPQKDFLIVLDFVGNYRNNYVAPLALSGYVPGDKTPPSQTGLSFKPPRECYIHPDKEVQEIWQESIRAKFMRMNTKDRLKQLYEEIWDDLGRERTPRVMDFLGHPLCADPMMFIAHGAFGNWLRAKEYCGGLDDIERAWLGTPAEAFLKHIERELNPVRSYKMVVLLGLLESGQTKTSWSLDEIAQRFKAYYVLNPLRMRDYDDLARAENPEEYPLHKVISHVKRMPLKYLSDKRDKFFVLEENRFSLKEEIHPYWTEGAFRNSIGDRVHFALARYWERRWRDVEEKSPKPAHQAQTTPRVTEVKPKLELLSFEEVRDRVFKEALPFVADVAAGFFTDSLGTGDLADLETMDWITVPASYCGEKRFVIRVAGDSMTPEFNVGDLLIFEYHRTPRRNREIVLAADFTLGETASTYAVKRLSVEKDHWVFESSNPAYENIRIPQNELPYPIVGTFVGQLPS